MLADLGSETDTDWQACGGPGDYNVGYHISTTAADPISISRLDLTGWRASGDVHAHADVLLSTFVGMPTNQYRETTRMPDREAGSSFLFALLPSG